MADEFVELFERAFVEQQVNAFARAEFALLVFALAALGSATSLGFASSQHRLTGYRRALAAAGIDYDPGLVRRGPHGPANAEALAAELLALPDRPSAIFAASDTQAMGVLTAADRCGVQVPGQLSVIGFDDIESAALLDLSTVRQPLEHSGAEGARRLCALANDFGSEVHISQEQLGIFVGAARESVNRQLQLWRKDGILDLQRGRILLNNMKKLTALARND